LITAGAVLLWNYLAKPFSLASSTFQNSESWDGETPFSLIYLVVSDVEEFAPATQSLGVIVFNPTQESLTAISVPADYKELDNLYARGNLSAERDGLRLARDSLRDLLGVTLDGYLIVSGGALAEAAELFPDSSGVKEYLSLSSLANLPEVWELARGGIQTDLDIPEILRILWYLMQVRADSVTGLTVAGELLDDPVSLDKRIAPFLRDEKLQAEHLKIQVLNGSGRPGAASSAARIIGNIGGEIIRIDNFERQDLVKGFLIMDASGSYTAARLSQMFGLADSRPPRTGPEARANITVILGLENSY